MTNWHAVSKQLWRSPCAHHEAKRVKREKGLICFHLYSIKSSRKRIRMGVYQTLGQAVREADGCCQKSRCHRMQPNVEWTQVDRHHYEGAGYTLERRPRAHSMTTWALLHDGELVAYFDTRPDAQAEVERRVRRA